MNFYKENDYILIKNFFNSEKILNESEKIIDQAIKNKWKFIQVFYNIFMFKKINIFSIYYPLNNFFKSHLEKYLKEIDLKKKLLEITKWKDLKTKAIEIQHNYKYNYQSTWHRDAMKYPSDEITVIIFLKNEYGFRVIPRNMNSKLSEYGVDPNIKTYLKADGYMNFSPDIYDIIDAKAGDLLVIDSSLLHQGYVKGPRTHILMRFKKSENILDNNDFFNKYNLYEELKHNTKIERLKEIAKTKESYNFDLNYFSFKNRLKSFVYFFFYYFPFHRVFKFIKDRKKRRTYFHYTYFQ